MRARTGPASPLQPWLVAVLLLAASAAGAAQEPSLLDVLVRATDYVSRYSEQLSGAVAEERYDQLSTGPAAGGFGRFPNERRDRYRRTLRSDYLLVRPLGTDRYYGFRDVFEVDGQPVRDRDERLTRLFLTPSASADAQIRGIMKDSSRYNIGDVQRNFNVPTLALLFLQPAYKPRFSFERVRHDNAPLGMDLPEETSELWVVGYNEDWPTTVIRGRERSNLPAEGRFWIEPASGRVLASELVVENDELAAIITVRYEVDPKVGHLVPAEMRERYENHRQNSRVDGTATYSDYRRFQVQVSESEPFRD
jgi:hypothetical protein